MGDIGLGRFGKFELVTRLGAGGMAETFIAKRPMSGGFQQRVCLKRILPSRQTDPEFVRMFLEEARIVGKLRHATIVQVIEAGEYRGAPYLALEMIDGSDLRKLMQALRTLREPFDMDCLVLVAQELATALEFAHRHRVLHRDVSPANVLISTAGEVKLADFGIAKAEGFGCNTEVGVIKGKAAYFSPEYAQSGIATEQSDLYALGVTLFELACGERPFVANKRSDAADALARRPPVAVRAPHVPPRLACAIDRLLLPDPTMRFKTAAELFDELGEMVPSLSARRKLGALASSLNRPPQGSEDDPTVVSIDGPNGTKPLDA